MYPIQVVGILVGLIFGAEHLADARGRVVACVHGKHTFSDPFRCSETGNSMGWRRCNTSQIGSTKMSPGAVADAKDKLISQLRIENVDVVHGHKVCLILSREIVEVRTEECRR